jgi:hypothetical protein
MTCGTLLHGKTSPEEEAMKYSLFLLGVLVTTVMSAPAEAQNYPWCAYYGGGATGGATNCGFSTFAQCMATVTGIGGFCGVNTQYVPPTATKGHRK